MASPVATTSPYVCATCRKGEGELQEGRLKTCGRCHSVYYCSVPCQKRGYSTHKMRCHQLAEVNHTLKMSLNVPGFKSRARAFRQEHKEFAQRVEGSNEQAEPSDWTKAASEGIGRIASISRDPELKSRFRAMSLHLAQGNLRELTEDGLQIRRDLLENAEKMLKEDVPADQMVEERRTIAEMRERLNVDPSDPTRIPPFDALRTLTLKIIRRLSSEYSSDSHLASKVSSGKRI